MKKFALLIVSVAFAVGLIWGCASMQTWPGYERNAETKMDVIEGKIGDGLKTGALTPDQSQTFLTKLKVIQRDYAALRNRNVYREEWDSLLGRLDLLEEEINRTSAQTKRIQEPRQTWPDYERSAETKMVVIQEKIGDGLKTGALTPDQSQGFLTKLKVIQRDYAALKDKQVYREEWDSLLGRLDSLGEEINRAPARTSGIQEPRIGDRIIALQRRIDDGRGNGRLPQTEGRELQAGLDAVRREYLRMTEGGRYTTQDERTDISRRLDLLEMDLNRFR